MRNTLFYCCLLTSSLVHFAVIKSLNSDRKFKIPPPKKTMEVTYQKVKTVKVEPPPEPKPKQEVSIAKEKQIRRDVKVLDKESDHFTVFDKEVKDISKFSRPVSLDKSGSLALKRWMDNARHLSNSCLRRKFRIRFTMIIIQPYAV